MSGYLLPLIFSSISNVWLSEDGLKNTVISICTSVLILTVLCGLSNHVAASFPMYARCKFNSIL